MDACCPCPKPSRNTGRFGTYPLLRALAALLALGLTSPALAGSRDLREDDQRKRLSLRDEAFGFELAAGITQFSLDAEWDGYDSAGRWFSDARTTVGMSLLEVQLRTHVVKSMGLHLGYFRASSDDAGVDRGRRASLGANGASFGVDLYPIGFRRFQTYVGATYLMGGSSFSTPVLSVGARIDLGPLKIIPRASYTEFSTDDGRDTDSDNWGWGYSVLVSWTFASREP